jgi:hypothetical protein
LPRLAWAAILFYASCCSWDDRHVPPCPAFFAVEMEVSQFLFFFTPKLAWNFDLPNLSLPQSWG